mmetsp:Transcript_14010/g.15663  ORF Transcript_14010/g.15663 Transcript_14010/m.15663 type:complete len:156 (+) Transcript_14010:18-485(+)
MKIIALFLILAISTVFGARAVGKVNKGVDLINLLEGNLPGTFLVMFYDHNADKGRISTARNNARDQILARHPDIHYYEVDVDDSEFQDLVQLIKIDKVEVEHMPSFLITYQGLGYTVHGEDAISNIVKSLSSKDWYLSHRHQRTAEEVEAEKNAE